MNDGLWGIVKISEILKYEAANYVFVNSILYYPTLVYAKYKDTTSGDGDAGADPEASAGQGAERGEREPLLG